MERFVVAYDIADDKRRLAVAKTLSDYGIRVQYSVFECNLRKEDYLRLRYKLEKIINREQDSLIFYHQCCRCSSKVERLGLVDNPFGSDLFIISTEE